MTRRRASGLVRRTLRVLLAFVLVVALAFGAASLLTPYSSFAQAMVWRDADVDDYLRFPARTIADTPEATPFRRGAVPAALGSARFGWRSLEAFLADAGTTAFLVVRRDRLLYERHFNGDTRSSIQTSFSVAKSFLSALVGIAIREGYIPTWSSPGSGPRRGESTGPPSSPGSTIS